MKKLLLFTVILSANALFAQLHISPSATDNYIFVDNDVVLYVEQGIDLERNTNNIETQASIYLRNNSQLLQGSSGVNSGDGQLSVWQFGTEDNFGYDNWSSPVGNNNGNSGSGNIPFGITSFYDAQLVSGDPHPTHSLAQISISGNDGQRDPSLRIARKWIHVLRGQGDYAGWSYVGDGNGIQPGDGFTMKGTIGTTAGDPQLYDFRGRPNNGTITRPNNGVGNWVYVGNPYPSHIDLAKFFDHNTDIEAQAWFYEKSDAAQSHNLIEIQSGYGTWVPSGGIEDIDEPYADGNEDRGVFTEATFQMYYENGDPIPCGSCVQNANTYEARFAQIGQGFMVEGNTLDIEFTNAMRLYVPAGYFNDFKSGPSTGAINDEDLPVEEPVINNSMLRFYVEINDTYRRDMVLGFSPNTTKGKDRGWDGKHPSLVASGDAYWALENEAEPYVIQNRPFEITDMIPLGIKSGSGATSYKVKLVEKINFNQRLYLFDKLNNTYQPIHYEDQSTAIINHATILMNEQTDINDRFYIVFKVGPTAGEVIKSASNVDFFQNNRASQLEVFNRDLLDIKNVSLYDMSGKLVLNESNLGVQSHLTFGTSRLSDGVYLVKLTTADNAVLDYKITIHNKY